MNEFDKAPAYEFKFKFNFLYKLCLSFLKRFFEYWIVNLLWCIQDDDVYFCYCRFRIEYIFGYYVEGVFMTNNIGTVII